VPLHDPARRAPVRGRAKPHPVLHADGQITGAPQEWVANHRLARCFTTETPRTQRAERNRFPFPAFLCVLCASVVEKWLSHHRQRDGGRRQLDLLLRQGRRATEKDTKTPGSSEKWTYAWSANGNLTEVKHDNSAATLVLTVDYSYDAFGEMIQKNDGTVLRFCQDGWGGEKVLGPGLTPFLCSLESSSNAPGRPAKRARAVNVAR